MLIPPNARILPIIRLPSEMGSYHVNSGFMKIAPGLLLAVATLAAQDTNDTSDTHIAAAKAAAGDDFQNLFNFQCYGPGPGGQRPVPGAPPAQGGGRGPGRAAGPPDRSTWHTE